MRAIQVLVVDDHPIVRHGLKQLLSQEPDIEVCGEAESMARGLELVGATQPDVALIDLALGDGDGMELIGQVRRRWGDVKMIVVSTCNAQTHAPLALEAGARGFVNKHEALDRIVEAIRCVVDGEIYPGQCVANGASRWFG